MRTSNPALQEKFLQSSRSYGLGETMTIQGTVNKIFIMLFLCVISAAWVWSKIVQPTPMFEEQAAQATVTNVQGWLIFGTIGGLICALVTIFKKEWAQYSAPAYALFEGLAIGGISAIFEMQYPGIVLQAVALTFGTMFCLLMVYKSGLIKVTDKFRKGLFAATGAIFLVYMMNFVMGFFGSGISLITSASPMGIGFSLIIVCVAALNLVLDFDFIERGASMGVPKQMEWYAAFGLMVTLIWLYFEILRLLAKTRRR